MVLGLDNESEDQIEQVKDLASGYLDKNALKESIKRLGEGSKAGGAAQASAALDIGIGAIDVGQDVAKSIKTGHISIAGDNDYKKAANVAGIVAAVAEGAAFADPLLAPAALVVGGGAELASDVLNYFGDKKDAEKQSSPATKQSSTISTPPPVKIPSMLSGGLVHLHNNNVLQKTIS